MRTVEMKEKITFLRLVQIKRKAKNFIWNAEIFCLCRILDAQFRFWDLVLDNKVPSNLSVQMGNFLAVLRQDEFQTKPEPQLRFFEKKYNCVSETLFAHQKLQLKFPNCLHRDRELHHLSVCATTRREIQQRARHFLESPKIILEQSLVPLLCSRPRTDAPDTVSLVVSMRWNIYSTEMEILQSCRSGTVGSARWNVFFEITFQRNGAPVCIHSRLRRRSSNKKRIGPGPRSNWYRGSACDIPKDLTTISTNARDLAPKECEGKGKKKERHICESQFPDSMYSFTKISASFTLLSEDRRSQTRRAPEEDHSSCFQRMIAVGKNGFWSQKFSRTKPFFKNNNTACAAWTASRASSVLPNRSRMLAFNLRTTALWPPSSFFLMSSARSATSRNQQVIFFTETDQSREELHQDDHSVRLELQMFWTSLEEETDEFEPFKHLTFIAAL